MNGPYPLDISDALYVVAAYGVILGAVGVYAVTLVRRLRQARASGTPPEERSAPGS